MNRWIPTIIMAISLFVSTAQASPTLSKQSVQKFLDKLSQAAKNKNSQVLIKSLAPSAKITLNLPEDMGGMVILNAKDYTSKLETTWSLPADYHYEISDINIIIIGDGTRAIVTECVVESISLNGETLLSTLTKERMMIEVIDGTPKITEIYGVVAQDL